MGGAHPQGFATFTIIRDGQASSGLFLLGFKMAGDGEDWGTNQQVRKVWK